MTTVEFIDNRTGIRENGKEWGVTAYEVQINGVTFTGVGKGRNNTIEFESDSYSKIYLTEEALEELRN